jgi:hypothetical protein
MDVGTERGYRALVRRSPRPSERHMRSFARFVSEDHSWYKKLPFGGEGEPFFLYLSPHVHEAAIETVDGGRAWRAIVRDGKRESIFASYAIDLRDGDVPPDLPMPVDHYAENMTTVDRHRYFGRWNYWNFGRPDQPRANALASAAAGGCLMTRGWTWSYRPRSSIWGWCTCGPRSAPGWARKQHASRHSGGNPGVPRRRMTVRPSCASCCMRCGGWSAGSTKLDRRLRVRRRGSGRCRVRRRGFGWRTR